MSRPKPAVDGRADRRRRHGRTQAPQRRPRGCVAPGTTPAPPPPSRAPPPAGPPSSVTSPVGNEHADPRYLSGRVYGARLASPYASAERQWRRALHSPLRCLSAGPDARAVTGATLPARAAARPACRRTPSGPMPPTTGTATRRKPTPLAATSCGRQEPCRPQNSYTRRLQRSPSSGC